jgi:membrane-associated phospholipid phosphatase
MRDQPASTVDSPETGVAAGQRWLLVRLVVESWRMLRRQLGAIPGKDWLRWGTGLVAGFAACVLLVFAVTNAMRQWNALGDMDAQGLRWVIATAPMAFADAIMYESPGNLLYLGPLTLLVAVLATRRGRGLVAVSLIAGYVLQRPLVLLGWMWWDRSRPDMVAGGVAAPAFHSFPSGHAALATFVYGFLAYLWIRATPRLLEKVFALLITTLWVTMVGVGRLRLGAHWPSDIVVGALIALAWLTVVIVLHRYLESRQPV